MVTVAVKSLWSTIVVVMIGAANFWATTRLTRCSIVVLEFVVTRSLGVPPGHNLAPAIPHSLVPGVKINLLDD